MEVGRRFGARVMLTSREHRSGTERCWEVATATGADLIVNVQADEPLVDVRHVNDLVAAFDDEEVQVATLAAPCCDPGDRAVVKVRLNARGDALAFSREPIPAGGPYLQHLGLYGFRRGALADFVELKPGEEELRESLEQLRLLENGRAIRVLRVPYAAPSVDTPDDLARVRTLIEGTT